MPIESVMPSKHLIFSCPLILPSISPSISIFSNESALQVAKVLELQLQHQPFQWVCRIDFLRIDCFDLLAVQGTLKGLLWHQNLKVSILLAQPSLSFNSHIGTWLLEKTAALSIQTFVAKVMSLLFNMLPRFVIAFLTRGKHLLILWLQSPFTVILEPKKIKSVTVSTEDPTQQTTDSESLPSLTGEAVQITWLFRYQYLYW